MIARLGMICLFFVAMNIAIASATPIQLKGFAYHHVFELSYAQGNKRLSVMHGAKRYDIALDGYTASEIYVADIDNDGNDEVIFIDNAGVSAGGELRILKWRNDGLSDIPSSFSANRLKLVKIKNKSYLMLLQHDTNEIFYVSNMLLLNNSELRDCISGKVWSHVIQKQYMPLLKKARDKITRSRYNGFIAMAYEKSGYLKVAQKYKLEALQLDPSNPFVQ